MKKLKLNETQIISALYKNQAGRRVTREQGIKHGTFYQWRKRYTVKDVLGKKW